MTNLIKRFADDESGATAIEYGLIAGLISIVVIATLGPVGEALTDVFGAISGALEGALEGAEGT
jgi:pilus assembly protein Flp/PilA